MLTQKQTQKINDFLADLKNPGDIRQIYPMLRRRLDHIALLDSVKYDKGMLVEFTHKGINIIGTIERVNRKTVTLKDCSDGGRGWRVGFSILRRPK